MLFNSTSFIFLLVPITVALFALVVASRPRAGLGVILAGSVVFYASWSIPYLVLLFLLIAINWLVSTVVHRSQTPTVLIVGLAFNLGVLFYFKYINFSLDIFSSVFGIVPPIHLAVTLPLGISFFTFQKISYLVDVYRRDVKPPSLFVFATYVLFFPQLIAGPIVRWRELQDQLNRPTRPTLPEFNVGLTFFVLGLVKKVLIADTVAPMASPTFDAAAAGMDPTFWAAWIAVLAYSLQIYFDFSGYSDMAIGVARMFRVRLPFNFDSPYRSASIAEFWRRWHMTLSRFLRDYLYIPLGGNRGGLARQCRNLAIVMILGGLWHGAGWTFVAWGALHGAGLVAHAVWKRIADRAWPNRISSSAWAAASWAATMALVLLAWVFFRSADLPTAMRMIGAMVSPAAVPLGTPEAVRAAIVAALLGFCIIAPNSQTWIEGEPPGLPIRWWHYGQDRPLLAVPLAVLFMLCVFSIGRPSEYIYFQF